MRAETKNWIDALCHTHTSVFFLFRTDMLLNVNMPLLGFAPGTLEQIQDYFSPRYVSKSHRLPLGPEVALQSVLNCLDNLHDTVMSYTNGQLWRVNARSTEVLIITDKLLLPHFLRTPSLLC